MIAAAFGYDEDVLRALSPRDRTAILFRAWTGVGSVAFSGAGAFYGAWLSSGDPWISTGAGVFFVLFVWNLLRLVAAATGVPVERDPADVRQWRPGSGPVLVSLVFAVFLAQPALLFLLRGEHDPEVARYREALGVRHERAVLEPLQRRRAELAEQAAGLEARLAAADRRLEELRGAPEDDVVARDAREEAERLVAFARSPATALRKELAALDAEIGRKRTDDVDDYVRHLGSMQFPVYRLHLAWERPVRAGLISLLFTFIVLLPLLARRLGKKALLPYELTRHDMQCLAVEREYLHWLTEAEPVVLRYPGWGPLPGPYGESRAPRRRLGRRLPARELLERLP